MVPLHYYFRFTIHSNQAGLQPYSHLPADIWANAACRCMLQR